MISKLPFPTTVPGNPKKPILNGVKKTPNELIKNAWMNLSPQQYANLFNCFNLSQRKSSYIASNLLVQSMTFMGTGKMVSAIVLQLSNK